MDQEKAIQFLLENMATLSAGLIGLQQQHAHLASVVERVVQMQERLVDHAQRTEDRFDRLTGIIEQLGNRVEQLAQAQQHTEERLNVLIKIVNGLVRGPLQ